MDVLAGWIADCCVIGKRCEAKAADFYASYGSWCDASGETAEPQRKWGMRLTERGFTRQRRMVGIFWRGIGLKTSDHVPNEPYEPDSAVCEPRENTAQKTAFSGSYGSYPTYDHPQATAGAAGSSPVESNPLQARIAELVAAGWHPVNARAKAEQEAREVAP
jgi:phage/plasmid-associated DNA primase